MSGPRASGPRASWPRAYHLALHVLPAELRRKHGPAMETLFVRELAQAHARGWAHGALAGAAGVWDVVRRGAYEQLRPEHEPVGARRRESAAADGAHGARLDGPGAPPPTTGVLLRRLAVAFVVAFGVLTASLLAVFASRRMPTLIAHGAPTDAHLAVIGLALPFTAAMTIPMAVLVAVLHEFTRLGADGTLAAARRVRGGVRRLTVPVLAAAVGVAALTLVLNTEVLPRANARLAAVLAGRPASARSTPSDREMTVGELRVAAREARVDAGPHARRFAAGYEVEVQKKYALAAACVVLALAGVVIPLRTSRGGAGLVTGVSGALLGAYYVLMVTGEDLADRLVVSPAVGMWGANALVLVVALLVVWRWRATHAAEHGGPVAVSR